MITIIIPGSEEFDEISNKFLYTKESSITLEHSLVSISKWESKWHKPFLSQEEKTYDELVDYIKCMTITQNVNPEVYKLLTRDNIKQVSSYIEDSMSATWFTDNNETNGVKSRRSSEQITSELIYYWMVALNIPFECQKWHLNRLLTLVRICNIKNTPPKKMSKKDVLSKQASLNAARRKQLHTSG